MIPPANMTQDESGGKEGEQDQDETPKSPTANGSQQETKVGLYYCYLLFRIDNHALVHQSNFNNRAGEENQKLLS